MSQHIPAIITAENYPSVHFLVDSNALATPVTYLSEDERLRDGERRRLQRLDNEALIATLEAREGNLGQYPYTIDPLTHRRIVNKTFKNNGVDVVIRGDEPSIRSVLSVLRTYPPRGPIYASEAEKKYYDLNEPICDDVDGGSDAAPKVGSYPYGDPSGDHIVAIMPDKSKFSGSGTILFISDRSVDDIRRNGIGHIYVPMLRDTSATMGDYASLGGRISRPDTSEGFNLNILYANAIKETEEESSALFKIEKIGDNDDDRTYVDVDSNDTSTKYRAYPYFIHSAGDLDRIKALYDSNTREVRRNPAYSDSYRETDQIAFFRLDQLKTTMDALTSGGRSVRRLTRSNFVDHRGNVLPIRDRTIRVLAKLFEDNYAILNQVLDPNNLRATTQSNDGVDRISF